MSLEERLACEINALWAPVYPHLAAHVVAVSGIRDGRLLELGPFAGGLALSVLWQNEGFLASVVADSDETLRAAEDRAAEGGYVSRLTTRCSPLEPLAEATGSFDLVACRGAFFFLTPSLLREVHRVLRPGGFAWVGGGYGPSTPSSVWNPLAAASRALNAALGKSRVTREEVEDQIRNAGLEKCSRVSCEGGLWIEMRP